MKKVLIVMMLVIISTSCQKQKKYCQNMTREYNQYLRQYEDNINYYVNHPTQSNLNTVNSSYETLKGYKIKMEEACK